MNIGSDTTGNRKIVKTRSTNKKKHKRRKRMPFKPIFGIERHFFLLLFQPGFGSCRLVTMLISRKRWVR